MSATTRAFLWLALIAAACVAYIAGSVIVATDRGSLIDLEERPMTPQTIAPAVIYAAPEEAESP